MNKSPYFLLLFIITSIAELTGVSMNWQSLQEIAKPLIMLSLAAYYFTRSPHRSFIFVFALFFCWAGDVLLMFQKEANLFFMFGLAAFLTGHLLYIISYRQHQSPHSDKELLATQKVRYAFPIILSGTGLVALLFPVLGDLRIPVMIYAIVLILMVMTALFRYGRTNPQSFRMVFAGAILFMVSDSVLAINKFYSAFTYSGLIIMLTYTSAQYLIVEGVVTHK